MISILLTLFILLISCVGCLFLQHELRYRHLRKIFPGCVLYLYGKIREYKHPDHAITISQDFYNEYKCDGLFVMYPDAKLIVYDLKLLDLILSTNTDKTVEYSFIKLWLAEGILTAKSDKWKVHKKLLAPAFSIGNLQHHIHTFNEQSAKLCTKLQDKVDTFSFNIHSYINLCTLDIILNTALGANINVQDNPTSEYNKCIKRMCDILYRRGFTLDKYAFAYYFSKYRKIEKETAKILNDFSDKFIHERKNCKDHCGVRTILDMVLECNELSDEDIRAEINTFIFAGHETTGSTLSFALYELGRNEEVQNKVYKEIIDVVGEYNDPTYADLEKLHYTSLMLKEVSRLYPGVPLISRTITKDLIWKEQVLPKGLECYVSLMDVHRNPNYFAEPNEFNPDRFNEDNINNIEPGAYLPFSTSPRGCIGQKFAQLEMKTLLVHLLRHFEIVPDWQHKLQLLTKVTLQSKNGIKISLKKRSKC